MGRFLNDFFKISKGMGIHNAFRFVWVPRVLNKVGVKKYSQSQVIDNFISKEFRDITQKFSNLEISHKDVDNIPKMIWVFWWQGFDSMPNVVKECYNSIIRNSNGREVVLITGETYMDYVIIPRYIVNKVSKGIISYTHFSDYLRVALLSKYGGLWIDAAIFVTKPIQYNNAYFYSPKLSLQQQESPHLHLWVIGVMEAPPNMPLFSFLLEILTAYWHRYNEVFSYLMLDYFIRYSYEHFRWFKDIIDTQQLNSPDLHSSRYMFDKEVDFARLEELLANNTFLSLTYRLHYPLQSDNGVETFYAALIKKYQD